MTCACALPCQYVATLVAGRVRATVAVALTERTTCSDRVATRRGTEASAECSARTAGSGEADGKDEDEQQTTQHEILQEGPGGTGHS